MLRIFLVCLAVTSISGIEVLDVDEVLGSPGVFSGLKLTAFDISNPAAVVKSFNSALSVPGVLSTAYQGFSTKFKGDKLAGSQNVFKSNLLSVFGHNLGARNGKESYSQGINQFSDLTVAQIREHYTGAIVPNMTRRDLFLEETPATLPTALNNHRVSRAAPESRDWRSWSGCVTPPKDQGNCGSCTDFALTGALESAMALYKQKTDLDLSEQELVDCPQGSGVGRCQGNWPEDIYEYQKKTGQVLEKVYRYEAKEGKCRSGSNAKNGQVSNYYKIPSKDANTMKEWVGTYGTASVVIQVDGGFGSYKSGVYSSSCDNTRWDHSVLVVGYGNENGKDYWIVKNSWGTGWGDGGYIKMQRGNNLCRIEEYGILPQA